MSGIAEKLKKVNPQKIVEKEGRKNPGANRSLAYEIALDAIQAAEHDSKLSIQFKGDKPLTTEAKGEEANKKYLINELGSIKDIVKTNEDFVDIIDKSLKKIYALTNSDEAMPDRKSIKERSVAANTLNVAERIIKGYAKGAIDNVEGLKDTFNEKNVHVTRELMA